MQISFWPDRAHLPFVAVSSPEEIWDAAQAFQVLIVWNCRYFEKKVWRDPLAFDRLQNGSAFQLLKMIPKMPLVPM